MTNQTIGRLCRYIERGLTHTGGDYHRIVDAIITLSDGIAFGETEDTIWYINEAGYTPGDIIAAAYWHFSEWHSGQWSKGYAALSSCGRVFSPGPLADSPEPDTVELDIYVGLGYMAADA